MEIDKSLQSDDRYFNVRVTNKKQVEVMYSLLGKSSPGRDDEDKDKQSGAESHFISYQTISNSNSFVNEYNNNNNNNNMSTQVTPRTATLLSCYINLCCTIIGAGMLGIPYGFSCVGWILGCILLVLCAISSGFALYFLTICGQLTKSPTSFHQVAEKAVPKYAWLVDASVAIKCYGAGISYMIIVADLMPVVMHSVAAPVSLHSRYFWVTLSFVLATPLVCFERLDSLKYTSALSILFILLLLIVVGLYGTHAAGFDPCADTNEDHCFDPTDMAIPLPWFNALKALPIFVFGYTCQQNTFVMVNEMRAPTQNKFNTVIVISLATAMLVYTITASFGYLTFGRYSLPDILTNYPGTMI